MNSKGHRLESIKEVRRTMLGFEATHRKRKMFKVFCLERRGGSQKVEVATVWELC